MNKFIGALIVCLASTTAFAEGACADYKVSIDVYSALEGGTLLSKSIDAKEQVRVWKADAEKEYQLCLAREASKQDTKTDKVSDEVKVEPKQK